MQTSSYKIRVSVESNAMTVRQIEIIIGILLTYRDIKEYNRIFSSHVYLYIIESMSPEEYAIWLCM